MVALSQQEKHHKFKAVRFHKEIDIRLEIIYSVLINHCFTANTDISSTS